MLTFKTEPVEDFYEIGKDIGSGQYSEVKLVTERSTGQDFAGKFVKKRRYASSRRGSKREDIVREVEILSELAHGQIISLHEVFETQTEMVLILELVTGGELFHYLAEKDHVSEEIAAKFTKQILEGLKHMHDRQICHLDLKPENIMLLNMNSHEVKLIDFGLSRKLSKNKDIREMVGTPEFIAPEVVNYEPLTLATDMWAIGVITYILLSGCSPFLGEDQQETYENVTAVDYDFDNEYFSSTSGLAKDFISKLLCKDPNQRASVDDCLNHVWIKPSNKIQRKLRDSSHLNTENLRRFNAKKRWKQSMKVVSICCRLSKNAKIRSTTGNLDGTPLCIPNVFLQLLKKNRLASAQSPSIPRKLKQTFAESVATRSQASLHAADSSDPLEDNDESFVLMAVFHAVEDGNLHGIKELVENLTTYDPNQKNKHGETALHMASGQGHLEIVDYLLNKGAKIDIKDKHGDNAIYWAARQGQVALIEYLKDKGCPVNEQNKTKETPLHVASRYGQVEAAQCLCSLGINVDIQDEDGETPLHIAAWHGYVGIVQKLCHINADLDLRNKDGETPILCASARGHLEIVSILVKAGAKLNSTDKQGLTSLHHAVRRHHYNIVRFLCESNCDVNMQDKFGETALHIASKDGSLHILELLHCAGSNVDTLSKSEMSPLQVASKHGHMEIVRYLCLSGCKLEHRNKDGLTASQIATLEGHEDVVLMFKQVQGEKMREVYVQQLSSNSGPLARIRLKIFGHQGVGKSTLIDSLKCGYLRGLFRRSKSNLSLIGRSATKKYMASKESLTGRSSSSSSSTEPDYNGTKGIETSHINVPGAGEFSVMEFSGAESYHTSYCHFMDDDGAINLIVFRLDDSFEDQLSQVTYWMNYLKSRLPVSEPIGHCGKYSQQMKVALVATHADFRVCPKLPSGELVSGEGNIVLYQIKKSFGRLFDICEMLFVVDANNSQSRDMKLLRTHLSNLRNAVVKHEPPLTVLCEAVLSILPVWRKSDKCQSFPVLTWQEFQEMVHTNINPLANELHLKDVIRQLHYMGEVQCFMSDLLQEIILIEPRWLCSTMIGQLLSPDTTDQPYGQYSVHYIQSVFPETDSMDIVQLLEAMDVCTQGTVCEFPSLIKSPAPLGIWEKEDENGNLSVYGGVRLQIADCMSVLPIGLFARLQLSLRRNFQQDVEDLDTDLVLWKDGAKCVSGGMEALLVLTNEGQSIEIRVRGINDTRQGCFVFMEDLIHLVRNVVEESYPGLLLNQDVLSPTQLRNHDRFVMNYEPKHIFQVQINKERSVRNEITEEDETFTDLFCFGSESIEANTIPGINLHVADLPELTRRQLSMLLDPPDPMGKDWCLMALSLGMIDRVPVLDPLNNRCGPEESDSPTERTLQEWGGDSGSTIGTLVLKLRDLGRDDAARVILNSMPMYKFLPDPRAMEESQMRINGTPNNSSSTVASR